MRPPSRHTTSFVGSPQPATAAGRLVPQRSAATHDLLVDDLLGHDATCMGAGGQFFGLPLILGRLDHVGQDPRPITTHRRRPLARAPRLDGRNMRQAVAPSHPNREA